MAQTRAHGSFCRGTGRKAAAKERYDRLSGVQDGLRCQVGVTLGHVNLRIPLVE
jgi:hypothetical protein